MKNPWELFGIECGYGWYGIVLPVLNKMEIWNRKHKEENPESDFECKPSQIKEKYGELCIYTCGTPEELVYDIDKAEFVSDYICEKCGSPFNVGKTEGWISTLCKRCADSDPSWKMHSTVCRQNEKGEWIPVKWTVIQYSKDKVEEITKEI